MRVHCLSPYSLQASEAKYEKDIAMKGEEMRSAGERITQLTEKIAEMVTAIESAQRQVPILEMMIPVQ